MKKYLIFVSILLCTIIISNNGNAQVPDTLAYLRSIVNNKSTFLGKTFSVLEDSLKIDIKSFFIHTPSRNINQETSTAYYFIVPNTLDEFDTPSIEIFWQQPLNANTSRQIFENARVTNLWWSSTASNFYSTGIIKDIEMFGETPLPKPGKWIIFSCTYKKVLVDGQYQWRYEVVKKFCENGELGTGAETYYSETVVTTEWCTMGEIE